MTLPVESPGSRAREVMERARKRILDAMEVGSQSPVEFSRWELEQFRSGSAAPLGVDTLDAAALTLAFDDLNQNRKERFDFGTVYGLIPAAELLLDRLKRSTADAIRDNRREDAKSIDQVRHRLRAAIRGVRAHHLSPERFKQEELADAADATADISQLMREIEAEPAPAPPPSQRRGRQRSKGPSTPEETEPAPSGKAAVKPWPRWMPVAIGAFVVAALLIGLARRRGGDERAVRPAPAVYTPIPHARFAASNLPVVGALQSNQDVQIVVDATWLHLPAQQRLEALAQFHLRLQSLGVARCRVVSSDGQAIARCDPSGCRAAEP